MYDPPKFLMQFKSFENLFFNYLEYDTGINGIKLRNIILKRITIVKYLYLRICVNV